MIKKPVIFVFCFMLLMAALPISSSADMGPKPSVVIDFIGLSGETYYATLLSSVESTGPYSALSFSKREKPYLDDRALYYGEKDYSVYLEFLDFKDADDYYFLQYFQDCSESHRFSWTYYPPRNFKILLYFPEKDSFVVSSATYDRYAFDSYFTATVDSEVRPNTIYYDYLGARESYDYSGEALSLIVRIILTVAIELLIALIFAFRNKKQLLFILITNLITQIGLNVALNVINFYNGAMAFVFFYILLELLVFTVEAILYTVFLRKHSEAIISKWRTITYALVANAASFAAGLGLAYIIPGIY